MQSVVDYLFSASPALRYDAELTAQFEAIYNSVNYKEGITNFFLQNMQNMDGHFVLKPTQVFPLIIDSVVVDVNKLMGYLGAQLQKEFMIKLSALIGRTEETIEAGIRARLVAALTDFSTDLASISIHLTPEEIYQMVIDNKAAISMRLINMLNTAHDLSALQGDQDAFWAHMVKCWNIIHPYDHLNQISGKHLSGLMNNIIGQLQTQPTVNGVPDLSNIGGIVQNMMGQENLVGQLTDALQSGEIHNMMSTISPNLAGILPKM